MNVGGVSRIDARVMDIWEEIRHDRESGARRMVAEFKNRLYSAALMLGCDEHEAEDLVFRTFAQAITKIKKFKPPKASSEADSSKSFYNWVFTILVNFRRMDVRRQKSRISMFFPEELPEVPDARPDASEELALAADGDRVRQAVEKLPEQWRMVVVLRYFEDLPTAEIARMLNVPDGTVRSRLHYAKGLLQTYLS